ncbi:transposase domain protein, partial [Neisseria meningitidis NM003]
GQWHSLSDPELEHSLITRIDFNLFCRFDELSSYSGLTKTSTALPRLSSKRTIL